MTPSKRFGDWQVLASSVILGGVMPLYSPSGILRQAACLLGLAFSGNPTKAQVVPDPTLGAERSVVTPQAPDSAVDVIEGGATRYANLFHSFEQFSVPTGSAAHFNNAANIQKIFSRVTGSSISNIDGLLRANGTANLFLLNPNGIIFGPNASLNIGGFFVGSTASSLNFADGNQFSATAPQTTPLLTVSVPVGLQFGGTAGSILNQSGTTNSRGEVAGLQVQLGRTLALVGGDVELDGGRLEAPGGRVELGGLAGAGTVGLNVDGNGLRLSFPHTVARADVFLTNSAQVNARAGGGGSIAINARNLDVFGGSIIRTGIASRLGSDDALAGDIEINTTEAINITNGSFISNTVLFGGVGKSGNINITTGSLSLTNDAFVSTGTFGRGNAGNLTITARDAVSVTNGAFLGTSTFGRGDAGNLTIQAESLSVTFDATLSITTFGLGNAGNLTITARDTVSFDGSTAASTVASGAVGKAGNIDITTGSLSVTNGGQLLAVTFGQGDAGSVNINARDTVSLNGVSSNGFSSGAFSTVELEAEGNSGSVNITTGSLSVTNGAQLLAVTFGQGDAGSVNINARDTVSFNGVGSDGFSSGAFSTVQSEAEGKAGSVNITTGSLSVTNGAQLQALTRGQGDAGSVNMNARDTVFFDGVGSNGFSSGAFSTVVSGAVGNGGGINITTSLLSLTNGAVVNASTRGQGDAGSVNINARDTVSFDGVGSNGFSSGAFSTVVSGAVGNGGGINITTELLSVTNSAELSASSEGSGAAGNIEVVADSIRLENQATLSSDTTGGQGNILLSSGDLVLRRGSNITTNATGTATGGNITIDTDFIVATEDSDISANAEEAFGGRVIIAAQGIFGTQFREGLTPQSDITASSRLGSEFSGTVEINTPDVDPSQGLVTLPSELVDASGLIAQTCPTGRGQGQSEFIVTGKGGLPPNSSEALSSEPVQVDWVTLNPKVENRSSPTVTTNLTALAPAPLVEAQGWVINAKGEVVLTATAPNVTPHSPWMTSFDCQPP